MPKLILSGSEKDYSPTVLLVDDDDDEFELACFSFTASNFENKILWLKSGQELIDYLLQKNEFAETGHKNPILILLDLNMPVLNGKETIEKLKEVRDISKLNIVLLSNADKEYIKSLGLENLHYIQKPLNFEKLKEYVSTKPELSLE